MAKKRILYFDFLNIVAALCVIFLHCNGASFFYQDTLAWKQAMLIEVVCYFAVPIFLMLSGANLLSYREKYSTKEFFKKRFLRTVIPFVIWSILVSVAKNISPFEIGFREYLSKFFTCSIESVYWFFMPLFAVYLSIPVLSLLKDKKQILWYMAGGAFVLQSLLPHLFVYMGVAYNGHLSMLTVAGYLIFPIIGYLFATTDFTKVQRIIIYALAVFGAAIRYFGTYLLSKRDGALNQTFYGYDAYFSVFLACGIFVFFKYFKPFEKAAANEKLCKAVSIISGCSFGIYLMHMTVYRVLDNFISPDTWQWRLLVPFLIYAVSLAITYILKKIPILKSIVP